MTDYKAEFFSHLKRLIDRSHLHKCLKCGAVDGAQYFDKKGYKTSKVAVVRLCLIDEAKPANDPKNVAYYCTRCRKGPKTDTRVPKAVRDSWPRLF